MLAFLGVMWGAIPNGIKFGALGLVAGVLVISGVYLYGKHEGRQQAAMAATKAIAKAYKDRNHENATVGATDAIGICVDLGASVHDCRAAMRGLGEDQPQAPIGGVPRQP